MNHALSHTKAFRPIKFPQLIRFRTDIEQKLAVEKLARKQNITVSEILRAALDEIISK